MPSFIDFLLAPWKIFGVLVGSGMPAIAVRPGAPPPIGSVCYQQNIGDQILSVCRVGGYEMPSFIFWASLLIFALFVLSSARMMQQCTMLGRALARVARRLSSPKPSNGSRAHALKSVDLEKIREVMTAEHAVAFAWEKFEDTLLISPETQEVFATEPVDACFSKTTVIEENISMAFFNAVPGVLTGLGLLMTFIAILDGLAHVTVAANMDVKGIGGLINGLSGKFVSSIVAVTCAVLFVFVERIAYSQPQAAYKKLIAQLTSRFRRRTTEQLLHELETQLRTQATLQRELVHAMTDLRPEGKR